MCSTRMVKVRPKASIAKMVKSLNTPSVLALPIVSVNPGIDTKGSSPSIVAVIELVKTSSS